MSVKRLEARDVFGPYHEAFRNLEILLLEEDNFATTNDAARQEVSVKSVTLRHGETHYQLEGRPEDPLLICIHGWTTASYVWDQLRPKLAAQGYYVLTYDLYGRGLSSRPDGVEHSAELFTEQLAELLQKLKLPNKNLTVVGYSMGGAIAASFVNQRLGDVKKLVLIAPAGMALRNPLARLFGKIFRRTGKRILYWQLPKQLPKTFREEAGDLIDEPPVRNVFERQMKDLGSQGYIPALISSLNGVLARPMKREHQRIAKSDLPIFAVFAAEDTTIPVRSAKRIFDKWHKGDKSVRVENRGHGITYTHPDDIMKHIHGFI